MARNPKKKSRKPTKAKKRAPPRRATNTNTVRVHVVNTVGGEAPAPYTGPDRGYFAFNPVFDMGTPKQALTPPMNIGANIASGPIKRQSEISTQTEGIFDDYMERANESMSLGSGRGDGGLSFAAMSPRQATPPVTPKPDKLPHEMTRNELRDVVREMGIAPGSKNKAQLLAIVQRSPG